MSKSVQQMLRSISAKSKGKRTPDECKVCYGPAMYFYVGALVCASCKMFFKRNAKKNHNQFKCLFEGNCDVNLTNRHVCSFCRLNKCFKMGMRVEMLRASITTKKKKKKKNEKMSVVRFATKNLLENDQSTLTFEQWNDLSNIIHCYDEYGHLSLAERYTIDQNQLPLKMRFKKQSIENIVVSMMTAARSLFEKNADFLSLSRRTSTNLISKTLKQICGFATAFVLEKTQLIHNENFCKVIQEIYGPLALEYDAIVHRRLPKDIVFVKLSLSIFSFSTFDSTQYVDEMPIVLSDIKSILKIQNRYVDLAWRYLLYRYGHNEAVRTFSDLIFCLLAFSNSVNAIGDVEKFKSLVNFLIKQTEECFNTAM